MESDEIKALETQIASDKRDLQQMEKREEELLGNIPGKGFHVARDRVVLGNKMGVLSDSIRNAELRLAAARRTSR